MIAFQYDEDWIKSGFSISSLSLPLRNDVFVSRKKTFDGLYGVFADSLPDGGENCCLGECYTKRGSIQISLALSQNLL